MNSPSRYRAAYPPLTERMNYSEHAQRLFEDTGALAVVLFTDDGIIAGRNQEAGKDQADSASAMGTSLFGAAVALAQIFPGDGTGGQQLRQVAVEVEGGRYVFVAQVGENVRVAVYTKPGVDLGSVSYEIARFAEWFAPRVAGRA